MINNLNFEEDDELLLNVVFEDETLISTKKVSQPIIDGCLLKKPKLDDSWDSERSPSTPSSETPQKANHTKCHTPNTAKRLFPGPAGLFANEDVSVAASQLNVCSQTSSTIFTGGPWQEMSEDFKISNSLYLYDRFNIAWIKRKANEKAFADHKAPFLAGVLVSLEVCTDQKHKSVNVTLKDFSGTIQGNIVYDLYQQHANYLILGAVLVLSKFGVLSCSCDKCDNHHLTISSKNLSSIYKRGDKTVLNKIVAQKVLAEYESSEKEIVINVKKPNILRCGSYNAVCKSELNMPSNNKFLAKACQNKCSVGSSPFSNTLANDNITDTLALDNRPKSLFTFKKTPTIVQNSEILDFLQNGDSEDKQKPFNENEKILKSPKKKFTFKKTSLTKVINDNNCDLVNGVNNFLNCSEPNDHVAIENDSVEQEQIWKEAMENVDLNSFFSDDF